MLEEEENNGTRFGQLGNGELFSVRATERSRLLLLGAHYAKGSILDSPPSFLLQSLGVSGRAALWHQGGSGGRAETRTSGSARRTVWLKYSWKAYL